MAIGLVGPDGKRYLVDRPEDVNGAVKAGYRLESESPQTTGEQIGEFASDSGDMLKVGAQGAAKSLTLGLSDLLLGANNEPLPPSSVDPSGDVLFGERAAINQEAMRPRKEHPIPFGVGEVLGAIMSPVNKVGTLVRGGIGATTALGRIGATALGEGAEGMLFGAGNMMSDAALGDHDLTAQKLVADIGLGGILGMAGGGVGAGLAEGFGAVAPKIGKAIESIRDPLLEIRDLFGMKAAGAMSKDFKAAAYRDNTRELVDLLVEKGVMKAGGKVDDVADAAVQLAKETGEKQGALAKAIEDGGGMVDGERLADDIDLAAKKYLNGNVGDQGIGKRLQSEAEALRAKGDMPFTQAEEAKRGFDKYLEYGAEQSPMQEGLKKVRGMLNAEIEGAAKKTGLPEVEQWLKAKKEMGLLAQVRDFAVSRAEGLKANRALSLSDHLVGGAGAIIGGMGGGIGGALVGGAIGMANKALRERLPAIIATAADKIANSPRLMMAAQSMGGQLQKSAPYMGEYAAPLMQAFERSPAQGLATHIAQAQTDPKYAAAAQTAGFLPETPAENLHATAKGNTLAAVAYKLDSQNKEITRGLDAVFRGAKPPKPPAAHDSQDFGAKRMRAKDTETSHRTRIREIRELAGNPEALLDRVTKNMGNVSEMAPGVAAAMTRTAHTAVDYLAKQSQEPPKAGPMAHTWTSTKAEQHEFSQRLEAVQEPMSVMRHAAAGTLVPAQWEAIQAVYPLLARQIQDMAMERLADPPKSVPYRARLMLSMITGLDVDGTMGAAVAMNQEAIGTSASKKDTIGPTDSNARDLTLGKMSATPGQKREMDINEA